MKFNVQVLTLTLALLLSASAFAQLPPAVPCGERCKAITSAGSAATDSLTYGTSVLSISVNLDSGDCDFITVDGGQVCAQDQGCTFIMTTTWTNMQVGTNILECHRTLPNGTRNCETPAAGAGNGSGQETYTHLQSCDDVETQLLASSISAAPGSVSMHVSVTVKCTSCLNTTQ